MLRRDPATAAVPIIMLTAKAAELDRIVGLELGAEGNGVTIIKRGLASTDRVVTSNQYRLQAGARIRPTSPTTQVPKDS